MRVLVVDEIGECESIARGLRAEGVTVAVAHNGRDAYNRALRTSFDVLVLERELPGLAGDEICRRLAAKGLATRILLLSTSATTEELVAGLDDGADDFLAKPYDFRELAARVHALGRREPVAARTVFSAHGIVLDSVRRTAVREGRPLALAPRHFSILEALLMADGVVVSGDELARFVWGKELRQCSTSLRTAMVGLRRALGEPTVIDTVIGFGYRISPRTDQRSTTPAPLRATGSAA